MSLISTTTRCVVNANDAAGLQVIHILGANINHSCTRLLCDGAPAPEECIAFACVPATMVNYQDKSYFRILRRELRENDPRQTERDRLTKELGWLAPAETIACMRPINHLSPQEMYRLERAIVNLCAGPVKEAYLQRHRRLAPEPQWQPRIQTGKHAWLEEYRQRGW